MSNSRLSFPALPHRRSGWATIFQGALMICLLACSACSRPEKPSNVAQGPARPVTPQSASPEQSTPSVKPPPQQDSPRVFVIELIERNEDSFSGLLFESDDSHGDEPPVLEISNGKLICRDFTQGQFSEQTITTEPAGTAWDKCKLFVIHTIHFAGKGRAEVGELFYAAAGNSVSIPCPDSPQGDAFTHDPNRAGIPFETALLGFRFFPQDAQAVALHCQNDRLEISVGAIAKTLQRNEQADLFQVEREISLREMPMLGSAVTDSEDLFDENPEPIADANSELTPQRDHGKKKFSTKLTVIYHGELVVDRISESPEHKK